MWSMKIKSFRSHHNKCIRTSKQKPPIIRTKFIIKFHLTITIFYHLYKRMFSNCYLWREAKKIIFYCITNGFCIAIIKKLTQLLIYINYRRKSNIKQTSSYIRNFIWCISPIDLSYINRNCMKILLSTRERRTKFFQL